MKKLVLAALLVSAGTGAAYAQDDSVTENYFAGSYVGVSIVHQTLKNTFAPHNAATQSKAKGWAPGIVLGYNAPVGEHFLLGIEGNLDDLLKKKVEYTDANKKKYSYDPSLSYGVAARAGVVLMPQLMAFGTVGWSRAPGHLTTSTPGATINDPVTLVKSNSNSSGMTYGGGLEFALTGHSFVRGQYSYSDLKNDRSASKIAISLGVRF